VRRLFGAQKAGHGGTLDPLASGVLPIALGEATKTVPFVMDGRKEYRFTLCFGEARSTEDLEGEVTATSDMLTIKGEKKVEKEEEDGGFYYSERNYGHFERNIARGLAEYQTAA